MNFCENICKEVNPLHLQDNSLFLKTDNILGKIMLSYMNKLITKTEKEQKLHYLKRFRKIEAYKKYLINTNPFLVFIEESARKKIKKKNVINSNTNYPLLHIKPFETTDVYPDIGFQITELTFNESKEYKIIIGNPPKTFFHYEYYSEEGDLLKALNHIKKKFAHEVAFFEGNLLRLSPMLHPIILLSLFIIPSLCFFSWIVETLPSSSCSQNNSSEFYLLI